MGWQGDYHFGVELLVGQPMKLVFLTRYHYNGIVVDVETAYEVVVGVGPFAFDRT